VGSYPLEHSLENMIRAYSDTVSIGISVPPIPQLRSFTDIYLEPLVRDGSLRRIGEGKYVPITLGEPSIDLGEIEDFLEHSGADPKRLRFAIAGPLTLASRVEEGGGGLQGSMLSKKDAVFSFFVPYVKRVVDWASSRGIGYVFLDEPVLGLMVGRRILFGYTEREILEIYEELLEGLDQEAGLHVCGRIPPLLAEILMRAPVRYLSLEFHDTAENMGVFTRDRLEESGKVISPGVVSARSAEVESREEVSSLLRSLIERFGRDSIDLVSADCGFGGLKGRDDAYNISLRKLRVISEVVSSLDERDMRDEDLLS